MSQKITEITEDQKRELEHVSAKFISIGLRTRLDKDPAKEITEEWKAEAKAAIVKMYECSGKTPPFVWFFGTSTEMAKEAERCLRAGEAIDPVTGVSTGKTKPPSDIKEALRSALFYGQFAAHAAAFSYGAREVLGLVEETKQMAGVEAAVELIGPSFIFEKAAFVGCHPFELTEKSVKEW